MNPLGRPPLRLRSLRRALVLVPTLAFLGVAQNLSPAQAPVPNMTSRSHDPFEQLGDAGPVTEDRRMDALNADRHKSMVSDAAKLLRLARELEQDVAASTPDGLTPQEMRRLAEIEKLARNVKEKMARSFGGSPLFQEPPAFPRSRSDRFPTVP